jgi:5S rRNA maturation endonuclease (ribonuclease M5)
MQTKPIEYIRSKGFEHKQQSGQIVLKNCPICHDEKWHFYIDPNDKGPWFCHKCQKKGNLWALMKAMGDIQYPIQPAFKTQEYKKPAQDKADTYHQALLKNPDVMAYVLGRGINQESIDKFKLGLYQNNGKKWLTIPHYQGKSLVNIKFRSLPPAAKTFRRIPGCKSILLNSDSLNGHKDAYLCEGELDTITLAQQGIENAIGATNGSGSFDPEWIDQLKDLEKIYIVYDPDEAGQRGARSLAKRLGYNRCYNIELPTGLDVNDFFSNGHDIFDFQKLAQNAYKFDLPGVISTDTAIDLLQKERERRSESIGLQTPWENVNRLTKGFHPGDFIILSAPPKTGKTTWVLNVSQALAFGSDPVLFYCLEMRPERLVRKVLQAHYKSESLTTKQIQAAKREFAGLPLYFAYSFKKLKLEDVLNLIRDSIKRYDLKFVVFDNIHFLVRSVSNVNEELGQAVQGFKLLAEEMEIPIMAIAQPRKRDASGRDEIMRAEDIKYSNAVHADCDQMIILHRKRIASKAKEIDGPVFAVKTEALDPVTLVRVEAHRYGAGGETLLYFHGEYSRFDPLYSRQTERIG